MKKGDVILEVIGALIMVASLVFGFAFTYVRGFKSQAVERGYAEYNQTTGAWQWKEVTK